MVVILLCFEGGSLFFKKKTPLPPFVLGVGGGNEPKAAREKEKRLMEWNSRGAEKGNDFIHDVSISLSSVSKPRGMK